MFTDSPTEIWFAVAAFIIANIGWISYGAVGRALINQRTVLKAVSAVFVVMGAYTALNGLLHLEGVLTFTSAIFGDPEVIQKAATVRRGLFGLALVAVWPLLAILFGGLCALFFTHAYMDTDFWRRHRDLDDDD